MVKDILGPRNGAFECLSAAENPLDEFLTGVLIPVWQDIDGQDEKEGEDKMDGPETGFDEIEDTSDEEAAEIPVISPSLNPKRRPSSMGITFFIKASTVPTRACITWGEYETIGHNENIHYQRQPKSEVIEIPSNGRGKIRISDKKEIYLHYHIKEFDSDNNERRISLFFVNEIEPEDRKKLKLENAIFQPQIRIKLGDGTKLQIGKDTFARDSEDSKMDLLYSHRDFNVRGHLCSVILKEFDPQIIGDELDSEAYSEAALKSPAFKWVDGAASAHLSEDEVVEFSEPDLRTDFVPLYSVPGPMYEVRDKKGNPFTFNAKDLSQMWNPEDLRKCLSPMLDSFEEWIKSNKDEIDVRSEKEKEILLRIHDEATLSLRRMKKGLNLLLIDANARLAFCLTNKAMDKQHAWSKKNESNLKWRPFQIAYFLLTMESISNPKSDERNFCDLLWVATGGGKTEAYLAIIAFTIILRRLKGRKTPDEGFGTSVITRYTLRLLAIQQFRRTLSLITALEYLRVLPHGDVQYGWIPQGCSVEGKYIFGSSPFTIGLWVGSSVTPNKLEDSNKHEGTEYGKEGAISILKRRQNPMDSSEPAQITNCPACDTILSIPGKGLEGGKHILHIIVKADHDKLSRVASTLERKYNKITLYGFNISKNSNKNYSNLKLEFEANNELSIEDIDVFLERLIDNLKQFDPTLDIASSYRTRPGYFLRTYINAKKRPNPYNFDIFCPNNDCPLTLKWFAGTPAGMIHNRNAQEFSDTEQISPSEKLKLKEIVDPFQSNGNIHYSDRIQIPALTVDEQMYMFPPTVLLSTVDKFARPAFEPRSSTLFGNFDYYHSIYGYYRKNLHGHGGGEHPSPSKGKTQLYVETEKADPPDLILQDELHLIDGPLGGMVGMYETALDYLISEKNGVLPKYIASTATIRNAEDQVMSVFTRKVHVFPPFGMNSDDRFFIRESEIHPIYDAPPGRLYLGIAAPGRGPLTPMYRIWARLLQTGWENKNDKDVNRFWTVTGYFNSIRELAGAVALYRQDIPQQLRVINREDPRQITEERKMELSSRINSIELPPILESLNREYEPGKRDAVDALFTTSMFGTGIDVSRLGLMIVNGQPKTTSSYIQSTGRIGRSEGGLVVTFLRVSRPRDLSHYEYFTGFHRQLHRFVEPVSVYPFAPKVVERTLGPVSVFILRNTRNDNVRWGLDQYAGKMPEYRESSQTVAKLKDIFESRAQKQPIMMRPHSGVIEKKAMKKICIWEQKNIISKGSSRMVKYVEYLNAKNDVVLGDSIHRHSKKVTIIYDDAPQSLRDIEETTSFET